MAHEREIVESRQFLSRIRVWPKERDLNVSAWLSNFDLGEDSDIAHALLDAFVYINDEHRKQALTSTLRSISTLSEFTKSADRRSAWTAFLENAIASIPLSHAGDGAASGYQYLRVARGLGFKRCIDSEHLVNDLLRKKDPRPVIFMDDIAGTGTQFIRNWQRSYSGSAGKSSLDKLTAEGRIGSVYFTPIVATETAKDAIEKATGVIVHPTYILGDDYSALDPDSRLVPPELRGNLAQVAMHYAERAGVAAQRALGYGQLGLAIGFPEKAPNNTLPILRVSEESATWKPLISHG